jgi:hypothetical protein
MFYDAMGYGLPVDERYTLERFFWFWKIK